VVHPGLPSRGGYADRRTAPQPNGVTAISSLDGPKSRFEGQIAQPNAFVKNSSLKAARLQRAFVIGPMVGQATLRRQNHVTSHSLASQPALVANSQQVQPPRTRACQARTASH